MFWISLIIVFVGLFAAFAALLNNNRTSFLISMFIALIGAVLLISKLGS